MEVTLGFLLVLIGTIGAGIVAVVAWPTRYLSLLALCLVAVGIGVLVA